MTQHPARPRSNSSRKWRIFTVSSRAMRLPAPTSPRSPAGPPIACRRQGSRGTDDLWRGDEVICSSDFGPVAIPAAEIINVTVVRIRSRPFDLDLDSADAGALGQGALGQGALVAAAVVAAASLGNVFADLVTRARYGIYVTWRDKEGLRQALFQMNKLDQIDFLQALSKVSGRTWKADR